MDRLAAIEAFVEAAERGSFTLAARRLHVTPSALSRRIAHLEGEMGVTLFHRTTRAIALTDEGGAFFERARSALRELDDAQRATSQLRDRPAGLLRVEAPTVLGRHVIVPALARFAERYPEVDVELVLRDHPGDLASERIDLAVRLGALPDSGLIARQVGRTRMLVCAAPSYLRAKGRPRTLDDLMNHERLGYALHGRSMPWRLRDGAGVREIAPTRRVVVDDGEALIELAIEGAGLAWMCDFMMERAARTKKLSEVLADSACEESPISVVSLPTRHVLPKVRAFAEELRAQLAGRDQSGRRPRSARA